MSTSCTPCYAGYSCPTTYSPPSPCPHGWYTSATGQTSCTKCPAGQYCSQTDTAPVACANGHYSLGGWTQCNSCPLGYICPNKDQVPVLVAISEYATQDQMTVTACGAGKARTSGGTCVDCPSGYTTHGGNNIRCTPCPPGHECTTATAAPAKCTANKHAYWMTQTCQACTNPAQQCMFRDRNYIEPCPHGTYMPTTNTNSLMCLPCPAGFSCHQRGTAVACAAKEYSMAGEIHCHKCPAGARCPDKLGFIMCTEGQYSDYGEDTCQVCPVGHYCPETHQTKQPCPPGTHQDGTSQTA